MTIVAGACQGVGIDTHGASARRNLSHFEVIMFVQPGHSDDGARLIVRAPNRRILLDKGEEVPETGFWMRRLRDGDVVLAPAPVDLVEAAPALDVRETGARS